MTDIVERLRRGAIDCGLAIGDAWNLCDEAADEIERLSGEVRVLRQTIGEIDRQHAAEIERLRELKTPASRELLNITKASLDAANDEIEIEHWKRLAESYLEENVRLRAALQSIVTRYETAEDGWPAEDMSEVAHRALGEAR